MNDDTIYNLFILYMCSLTNNNKFLIKKKLCEKFILTPNKQHLPLVLTLYLCGKTKQCNKKYGKRQLCTRKRPTQGSFGIIKVFLTYERGKNNIRFSLLLNTCYHIKLRKISSSDFVKFCFCIFGPKNVPFFKNPNSHLYPLPTFFGNFRKLNEEIYRKKLQKCWFWFLWAQ